MELNEITEVDAYLLVQKVRSETHISHELSCRTVVTVLNNLISLMPESAGLFVNNILQFLNKNEPLKAPSVIVNRTDDMYQLIDISQSLTDIRNDSQQRSWELFEDETVIKNYLTRFNSIVTDADTAIIETFLHQDEFAIVSCLAEYYQMETRWSIRKLLLELFTNMCHIHRTVCIQLLNSVLPLELSRDIQSSSENMDRLLLSIDVLTLILSIGLPVPVTYLDTMGKEFILYLLNIIERFSEMDEMQDEPEKLVKFIIVYNYSFRSMSIDDNIILAALCECENPKIFTETLLFIFNRCDDPIKMCRHTTQPSNSLIKLMIDLFSRKETIAIFYTNDIEVFLDIVIRQLTDISSEDKERKEWLMLVNQILLNCEYDLYKNRIRDLQFCFNGILKEESPSDDDLVLVKDIMKNYSQLFIHK